MLKDFQPRLYQQTILGTAASYNTLVVLPTGLGKTAVAFLLAAQRLHQYPNSKILLLSPTKPLCEQHIETFRRHLDLPAEKIVLFTGSITPAKRETLWQEAVVVVSTPQGLENDVINKRIELGNVSLLVFDEGHHATGDYSYVWLAQQYDSLARYPRILALTASPGSDLAKIKEVCQNLKIEKVEVRVETDPDVKPYIQEVKKNWFEVDFPPSFQKIQKILQVCRQSKLLEAQKLGFCSNVEASKRELLALQGDMQRRLSQGERDFEILRSVSLMAEALKVDHAMELLESQGIKQLNEYLQKIQQEARTSKIKAVKNLMLDGNFKSAIYLTEELLRRDVVHPKIIKLREIVQEIIKEKQDAKLIIFTQFRDSAESIVRQLDELNIRNHIFVGQAKKKGIGFSQKQQKEILDRFRNGEFSVLVATSVAEEGLDIPKVDKVVFYEPIPSAIRSIQRSGRTGRLEKGEVTILVTKGTRDEAYRWSSFHKEKRMFRNLDKIRREFSLRDIPQKLNKTLAQFIPSEQVVAVVADHREKDNKVIKELIGLGVSVKTAQLHSADYVISGKVGVELKKVPDFVASIIDGRLLEQVRDLKQHFTKAVVIIEGEEDIYAIRKVHANAIRGMLASIVLGFSVPILYTKNPRDTAHLLAVMAKREQDTERDFSYHVSKPRSLREQQEFIISSLPSMGPLFAARLLEHFGSIKAVVNATREELLTVPGIGGKTAQGILEILHEKYLRKDL